jgi:hypothetical protein
VDGPTFPESDLTSEERIDAVAEILLRGVRRLAAERGREKTRRWRERRADQGGSNRVDVPRGTSPPVPEEDAGCGNGS